MANNYEAILRYYYNLIGHKPRIRVIPYFKQVRRSLRCPACGGDAHVLDAYLVCDRCNRGWPLQALLYPDIDLGPATSSGPASGEPASGSKENMTQPDKDPHVCQGCVNSFCGRLI